jgi:Putative rhamnosyl transferase
VDHVLLTRFNLPSVGVERIVRAKEGWLRDRVALFDRYCLPSVRAQTDRRSHWIVYLDPESPGWLKDGIAERAADGTFTPIYRTAVSRDELRADLRAVTGAGGAALLTTNLDNDDAIATDFVERLRGADTGGERTAVYLTQGLIRHGDRLYLRTDRRNAFCSVREGWDDPVTCWADWHNLLGDRMAVRELGGEPAWLQVVHGMNVSNRVHGRRVAPAPYLAAFGGLLADLPAPTPLELLADVALDRPRRYLRESGRATVKRAVMAVTGKEGLERLKLLRAARSASPGAPGSG